jgi:tetratricopeptide (TPR) repeat protein
MLRSRAESAGKPAARPWPVNRPYSASAGDAEPRLQPRVMGRNLSWFALLGALLLAARPLSGQAIGQGFELERAGQYEQAASIYFATLRAEPTNLSALLGLERVLPPLNRLRELLPAAQRAATASPTNVALRGILLRTYVALNEPDSARAVALRWAAGTPRDEAPYREWAMALADAHQYAGAHDVLLAGRQTLDRQGAFAIELAQLSRLSGDWEGAAREWAAALSDAPVQLPNAASELAEAPDAQRERIARLLTAGTPPPLTRRLAGELILGWGQPERAWAVFEPSVATPSTEAAVALRRFADLAGARSTPDARRVRALALARYADFVPEPAAARARADAARAFIEAGDRVAARQVLERVAQDTAAPSDAQQLAQTAVVEALIEAGQLDEAAHRLTVNDRLSDDARAQLRLQLTRARITSGDLDRAEETVARDSGVEALALKGWIALYRGRLKEAQELFRAAGPYAGDRRDATDRTEMLALMQQVPMDAFPELGAALLLVARGDSVGAVTALSRAADRLDPPGWGTGSTTGRPDVLLLAGRVAARLGLEQQLAALALFDEVVRTGGQGAAAPAAELEWARLLERRLQMGDAIQHLEHLILSYPGSSVVPEARRELERAKGAIPKS